MAFSDYYSVASLNVTIGGVNIAEGCAASNVNDAIRQLMADGRLLSDIVSTINTSSFMLKSGGAFTGQITRNGNGGYFYNANGSQGGGKVSFLPTGSANPSSPAEGDMVFFY